MTEQIQFYWSNTRKINKTLQSAKGEKKTVRGFIYFISALKTKEAKSL